MLCAHARPFELIVPPFPVTVLVMVHQIGFVIDKRLRYRYFFHPTMSESDWASEDGDPEGCKGGGFAHSELRMTIESIPNSMLGGNGSSPPSQYRDHPESTSLIDAECSPNRLNLEMAQLQSPVSNTPKSQRKLSYGDEHGTPKDDIPDSLRMKRDTPDLVERASSKTFSKIALPKMSPRPEDTNIRKLQMNIEGPSPPLI